METQDSAPARAQSWNDIRDYAEYGLLEQDDFIVLLHNVAHPVRRSATEEAADARLRDYAPPQRERVGNVRARPLSREDRELQLLAQQVFLSVPARWAKATIVKNKVVVKRVTHRVWSQPARVSDKNVRGQFYQSSRFRRWGD